MTKRLAVSDAAKQHLGQWYSAQLLDNTRVLRGSIFGWLFGRFGQHAVTINKTVHLTPHAPDVESDDGISLLGHELFHVMQQAEMGWWRFLARYIWRWRPSHVKQGWKHPLEEPAYKRQGEIREKLQKP
jgi:hypothetical protein